MHPAVTSCRRGSESLPAWAPEPELLCPRTCSSRSPRQCTVYPCSDRDNRNITYDLIKCLILQVHNIDPKAQAISIKKLKILSSLFQIMFLIIAEGIEGKIRLSYVNFFQCLESNTNFAQHASYHLI